ncbi:hypothetical protein AURDEDRAFT_165817 [Auricularia subglabra TFB-10046 SS5]|nr:hypothetical protein AURDEDRAFT_165817 [Auricularia subglabra TFB-10046 SS5]
MFVAAPFVELTFQVSKHALPPADTATPRAAANAGFCKVVIVLRACRFAMQRVREQQPSVFPANDVQVPHSFQQFNPPARRGDA